MINKKPYTPITQEKIKELANQRFLLHRALEKRRQKTPSPSPRINISPEEQRNNNKIFIHQLTLAQLRENPLPLILYDTMKADKWLTPIIQNNSSPKLIKLFIEQIANHQIPVYIMHLMQTANLT